MSLLSFSIPKAHEAQALLCRKIVQEDRLPERIRLVAGVDAAYFDERAVGAVAVLDYETMRVVETQTVTVPVRFPYVPTLLSFREIPPQQWRALESLCCSLTFFLPTDME